LFPELATPNLVGIARLAAESDLLEAKRKVRYFDLPTRALIGRASGREMPFEWTVNPYRGCEFGCKYCYARYTHEFMELRDWRDFEQQIYSKQFSPDRFRAELHRIPRADTVCIGTATDPYQPAERRYKNTRRILEVLAGERGRTFCLTTKSDLVARDAELMAAISEHNNFHVFMTITTTDERLARLVEPYAPRPDLRLKAMRCLTEHGVRTVALACPVMPLLNDSRSSLESVARAVASSGAEYMYGNVLFLKPCAQAAFYPFLEQHFPHLARKYRERFARRSFLNGAYPETIRNRMDEVRKKYGLTRRPAKYIPDVPEAAEQLSFWA
jgi:DNA repair photolyase